MTRFAEALFFLCFLTSSMDIFGSFALAGYTVRIVYLLMVVLGVLAVLDAGKTGKISTRMAGGLPFLLWTVVLSIFTVSSPLYMRSFLYLAWLALSTLMVLGTSQLVRKEEVFQKLVKSWLAATVCIACFGILQFIVGLFGFRMLTPQYWNAILVRVNGFCYEPSFFVTYLIGPWAVLFVLFLNRDKLDFRFPVGIAFVLVTMAMLLSTSRLGILALIVVVAVFCLLELVRLLRTRFRVLRWRREIFLVFALICLAGGSLYVASHWKNVRFLFNGTGIGDTANASVSIRTGAQDMLISAINDNPLLGVGLGGVPSAVAAQQGIFIDNQADAKPFEGSNVFLEIITASGLPGALCFFSFLIMLAGKLLHSWKTGQHGGQNGILRLGFLLGLTLTFSLLMANQNILRPYVWILIALANAGLFVERDTTVEEVKA